MWWKAGGRAGKRRYCYDVQYRNSVAHTKELLGLMILFVSVYALETEYRIGLVVSPLDKN